MSDAANRELGALRKLREVLLLVTAERDIERLLPLVLEQAIELVGGERGFIIRTGAGTFDIATARNFDREDILDPEFKVSRSIVERVTRSGTAELIHDAREDTRTKDVTSLLALRVVSLMCVPLKVHGRTLGVLYIDHRHVRRRFQEPDLATLEAFAVPAASVLDSVARAAEIERSREELRRSRDELANRVEIIESLRAELAERYRERTREANRLRGLSVGALSGPSVDVPGVIARSPAMKRVLALLRKAAPADAPVLILGESGVGKEVLARAIHALSLRARGPFVAENCAALADPLLESELFGHEAGSFTGAVASRQGLFEVARGGTIFLDEVGDMSPALQSKLLRVLQEKEVRHVGSGVKIPIDVRVVAATHRDLERMVAVGTFRADLFYRLNVVRLEVPPLRERTEDVGALLDHFVERLARGLVIEPQARELLVAHPWPGNARELENEVRRLAVVAGQGGVVRPGLLSPAIFGRVAPPLAAPSAPAAARDPSSDPPIEGVWRLDELERAMIERALKSARGRRGVAARLLGLTKASFYRRLRKHGFEVSGAEESGTSEDDDAS